MYNGIGLPTVRGTGTSGYVQTNRAALRPSVRARARAHPHTNRSSRPARLQNESGVRPPSALAEHEARRRIEVAVAELEDDLVNRDYAPNDIAVMTQRLRQDLLTRAPDAQETQAFQDRALEGRRRHNSGAQPSLLPLPPDLAQRRDLRLRDAFRIPNTYFAGAAFTCDAEDPLRDVSRSATDPPRIGHNASNIPLILQPTSRASPATAVDEQPNDEITALINPPGPTVPSIFPHTGPATILPAVTTSPNENTGIEANKSEDSQLHAAAELDEIADAPSPPTSNSPSAKRHMSETESVVGYLVSAHDLPLPTASEHKQPQEPEPRSRSHSRSRSSSRALLRSSPRRRSPSHPRSLSRSRSPPPSRTRRRSPPRSRPRSPSNSPLRSRFRLRPPVSRKRTTLQPARSQSGPRVPKPVRSSKLNRPDCSSINSLSSGSSPETGRYYKRRGRPASPSYFSTSSSSRSRSRSQSYSPRRKFRRPRRRSPTPSLSSSYSPPPKRRRHHHKVDTKPRSGSPLLPEYSRHRERPQRSRRLASPSPSRSLSPRTYLRPKPELKVSTSLSKFSPSRTYHSRKRRRSHGRPRRLSISSSGSRSRSRSKSRSRSPPYSSSRSGCSSQSPSLNGRYNSKRYDRRANRKPSRHHYKYGGRRSRCHSVSRSRSASISSSESRSQVRCDRRLNARPNPDSRSYPLLRSGRDAQHFSREERTPKQVNVRRNHR